MEQKEKIDQLVAENQELLALTKQALVKREVERESVPVDEEWEKFYAEHSEEIEALGSEHSIEPQAAATKASMMPAHNDAGREQARPYGKRLMGILPYKVAASIIGILCTAGVAFAAIHIFSPSPSAKEEESQYTQVSDTVKKAATPLSTKRGTRGEAPVVFDNVALETMLPQIAAYYHKEVDFQNADARQLRFYFVWKKDETLDVVLHRLNLFESITVELKSDKIIVE